MSNIAETISANQSKSFNVTGRFVRLMNATGPVEISYFLNGSEIARTGTVQAGYAEEFDEVFDSFRIADKSGASNTVEILYRMNSRARYDRAAGTVQVTNSVSTRVPVAAFSDPASFYGSVTALAANAPVQVVAPVANVNGIIVWSADMFSNNASAVTEALIAKNAAPASVVDGSIVALSSCIQQGSTNWISQGGSHVPIKIPAGLGLYFIASAAQSGSARQCSYTIL